ncbi:MULTISPECIES: hypothetical protein [Bradyrhizobium]|uniref:ImmA/IrrE family metallo-endopeptidase n=2 Tax=Nitrobacteraceae TaxID=41294 RepID=A0A7Y8QXQ3_BRAEL|nr:MULTISPECIES: hypothetical protein [Bradyrhizobium]MBP1299199.1 hypothetical protein [Bradyrhizobium elkanii]MBP2428291.1 hypothetical protein [Bradyrhizobium elkanii]MCP1756224.1 hypothetical protein [Bradyrhizobium elkanii]MCP1929942.1 hypothetical protein [Bradyrhizobium elkanii]MCP1981739.1 hypothetical protein [Bradyrhizobium elkanii]
MVITDLKRHFLKLCADEEVDVQWCDNPLQALALSGELEFIRTPRIASEITYAVAMHELGHIKSGDRSTDQIARERAAWDWARCNALKWTPHMEGYAAASLRWYEEHLPEPAGKTRQPLKRPLD